MRCNGFRLLAIVLCVPAVAMAGKPKSCVTAGEAAGMNDKDVCVSAHIYNVVRLADGTRFLDVCPPQMPDSDCRFTIVSYSDDHGTVGDLQAYRNRDVRIRGVIEPMNGRSVMILSHARQFHGGRPRFRPNPMLSGGFDAAASRPAFAAPGLNSHGSHRSFMNTRSLRPSPASKDSQSTR